MIKYDGKPPRQRNLNCKRKEQVKREEGESRRQVQNSLEYCYESSLDQEIRSKNNQIKEEGYTIYIGLRNNKSKMGI